LKCVICGQRNVDGALDQNREFVCVDCFADGSAKFSGRKAKALAPVPGPRYDYSGIDHTKALESWNK